MKLSSPQALLDAKIKNVFSGQRRRAKIYGCSLDYSLDDLRGLVGNISLFGRCVYCKDLLTLATITLDHITPVSLGGAHSISNLQKICKDCNLVKSSLTDPQMMGLLAAMRDWPAKAITDLRARLKLGGARYRGGYFKRRRKWKKK